MLRSNSARTVSLVDLNAHEGVAGDGEERSIRTVRVISRSNDRYAGPGPHAATSVSDKSAGPHSALKCPVNEGMRGASQKVRQVLELGAFDFIAHNGCVLDADDISSADKYLATCRIMLDSPFQSAPQDEIGRMMEVARQCYKRAKMFHATHEEYAATDRGHLRVLAYRTSVAMAKAALGERQDGPLEGERKQACVDEALRLHPAAKTLVGERSRGAQAARHALAWEKFSEEITAFCYGYIESLYPECVSDARLRIDAKLAKQDPVQAREQARSDALYEKWGDLELEVLYGGTYLYDAKRRARAARGR